MLLGPRVMFLRTICKRILESLRLLLSLELLHGGWLAVLLTMRGIWLTLHAPLDRGSVVVEASHC